MVIYTRFTKILSIGKNGIALWPFAFIAPELRGDEDIVMHEKIHLAQQKELWVIPFYVLYVLFWVKGLVKREENAYLSIPFEKEAYTNEKDEGYLTNRKRFAWVGYIGAV